MAQPPVQGPQGLTSPVLIAPLGGCPGQNYLSLALAHALAAQGCEPILAARRGWGHGRFEECRESRFQIGNNLEDTIRAHSGATVLLVEGEHPSWLRRARDAGAGLVLEVPMGDMIREEILTREYWRGLDGAVMLCDLPELTAFLAPYPTQRWDLDLRPILGGRRHVGGGGILSLCPIEGNGMKKGSDLVCASARALRIEGCAVPWTITMDRPTWDVQAAVDAGVLTWVPVLPREELLDLLASADLLVCLERAGGYGMTCREARAMGVPVLAPAFAPFAEAATYPVAPRVFAPGPCGLMPWRSVHPADVVGTILMALARTHAGG